MSESRIVLRFPKRLLDQPVISTVVSKFGLHFNILRADVTQESEGLVVLGLEGEGSSVEDAITWLEDQGVNVKPLDRTVVRDDDICTDCGACLVVCPSGALAIDLDTREVGFHADKCVACGACVPVCPPRAMSITF